MKKKILIIISLLIILTSIGIFSYFRFFKYEIVLKKELIAEVNSKKYIKDYIYSTKNIKNVENDKIDTTKIGKKTIKFKFNKRIGNGKYKLDIDVVDTIAPKIEFTDELNTIEGKEIDLLSNVKVTDNSNETIVANIEGEYDFNKVGEYNLYYIAKDSSGNEAKESFILNVTEDTSKKIVAQSTPTPSKSNDTNNQVNKKPYYIKINRKQNVVMVYGLENGEYTKLIKVFTCSTGPATPLGTFNTTDKYVWRPLFGDVYGQYATRITGSILFHSVPYKSQSKDTLKYEEYNKLGTAASMGCIRLTVADTKWIYDNCPKGTTVTIYDSDSLDGIEKPVISLIDENSPNKYWDPTDPDINNPW